MSSGIPEDYNLPDYHNFCYVEELFTVPLLNLFQKSRGYWWVLPGQQQQIFKNLNNKLWKLSTQLRSEINFAGVPISREEAIENAIPYKEEHQDPDNIEVGYHC